MGEILAELVGRRHTIAEQWQSDAPEIGQEAGRGTLFVSVHRGNWIVGARALGDPADPLHTVAGTQLHPRVSSWLLRWLRRQGVEAHPPGGSWPAFQRALRRGGRVFLHLDGDPYAPGSAGWRPRTVPPGVRSAALLAARCSPRVEGVLCMRVPGNRFLVRRTRLQIDAGDEGVAEGASDRTVLWERLLLTHLRSVVSEDPEDWILFRDRHLGGETSS